MVKSWEILDDIITLFHFRHFEEKVNVKYAYIKNITEDHTRSSEPEVELCVRRDQDWVYLIVTAWEEDHIPTVPASPARYKTNSAVVSDI